MAMRKAVRRLVLAASTAVLLAAGTAPLAQSTLPALAEELPPCPAQPGQHGRGLAVPPDRGDQPAPVCQARPTGMIAAAAGLPLPEPGYHHLGATSGGGWSGVMGRLTVRDPGVRAGTHDFVATRFMAKRQQPSGISWLEAGWAETGWSGDGRQRVYTFDTASRSWTFYDQYPLRDGDQIWLYIHTDGEPPAGTDPTPAAGGPPAAPKPAAGDPTPGTDGPPAAPEAAQASSPPAAPADRSGTGPATGGADGPAEPTRWQAWLWWGGGWHLLVAKELPLGRAAQVEQYVEVYVDPRRGTEGYPVPRVPVENVYVKPSPDGALRPWTQEVPTAPGQSRGRYCLNWRNRYDTWDAGDCDVPAGSSAQGD